jgi:DNA mismatch repair protein MutL
MDVRPVAPALSSDERDLHRHSGGDVAASPLDEPLTENVVQELIPEMEPLAQFADSYILAQGGEGLYIIDQHALHERIRYERIRNSPDSWNPQPLITPLSIEMSVVQAAAADGNQELLERLGIELQQQEGEWNLLSIPVLLAGDSRLHGFLQDLLTELSEEGSEGHLDAIDQLQDQIAFMRSCRGAVKANQSLNIAEMRRLLVDMRSIDNPWACVHGRPTVLKIEAEGLDHHFGRHG